MNRRFFFSAMLGAPAVSALSIHAATPPSQPTLRHYVRPSVCGGCGMSLIIHEVNEKLYVVCPSEHCRQFSQVLHLPECPVEAERATKAEAAAVMQAVEESFRHGWGNPR